MKIYIHGANATPTCWNYIKNNIGDGMMISYDCSNGFKNNLEIMKRQLANVDNFQFISHSLGGIYALHLADYFSDRVICGISLSTPYGGYEVPLLLRYYLHWHRLIHDIIPEEWPISACNKIIIKWPWTNIVSTSGSVPWSIEPNDGVVTIKSQCIRNDMELIKLNCNHYEIMLNQPTVDIIQERLEQCAEVNLPRIAIS